MRHGKKKRVISENTRKRYIQEEYGGRYKIRTCDPFRVREVRYLCANRPGLYHLTETIMLRIPCKREVGTRVELVYTALQAAA
jgi:hypothetical protein